jgi:hypothetical protein
VPAQLEARSEIRASQHRAPSPTQPTRRRQRDASTLSRRFDNLAEYVASEHFGVGRREGIALREQAPTAEGKHAMREQSAVPAKQHDIARRNFSQSARPDLEFVTGRKDRKHACAARAHPLLARTGQRLEGQLDGGRGYPAGVGHGQDSFGTVLQMPPVPPILPQPSAIVSNTFSCLKAGFW